MDKRVAVFIHDFSVSGTTHSGGRYHALLLAHAIAASGSEVTVVVNTLPGVAADLASNLSNRLTFVVTDSYDPQAISGTYDYVVVAPSGGLVPDFYSCAEAITSRSDATPVLINYESANWFNSMAPTPDFLEVWEPWRRTVVRGGVVLSSTLEGDRYARDYYRADDRALEFAQCYPPLNSGVASIVRGESIQRDGSLLYFARPFSDHKGGTDVLRLDSCVLSDRTLRVIFGGEVHMDFTRRLEERVLHCGGKLEVHSQVTELEKFRLLARSSLLIFPSSFEGFGYPPLEAFLVGTPAVCYDLPVLRETLGHLGHFAPQGDSEAFSALVSDTLSRDLSGSHLWEHAETVAGFAETTHRLAELLEHWSDIAGERSPAAATVAWGPWEFESLDAVQSVQDCAPLPPYASDLIVDQHGYQIRLVFWSAVPVIGALLIGAGVQINALTVQVRPYSDEWLRVECEFALARGIAGQELRLISTGSGRTAPSQVVGCLRLGAPTI